MRIDLRYVCTIIFIAILGALAVLFAHMTLAPEAEAAETFHFSGKSANANVYTYSKDNCVSTSLYVTVHENMYRGDEIQEWSGASIHLSEYDYCSWETLVSASVWVNDLTDDEYDIHKSARKASLDIDVVLHDKVSGEEILLAIKLAWEADGSSSNNGVSRYVYETPFFVSRSRSNGRSVGAAVTGTVEEFFDGEYTTILVINDEANAWGTVSRNKGGTTTIYRR